MIKREDYNLPGAAAPAEPESFPVLTDNDEQHRELAFGAVAEAHYQLETYANENTDPRTFTSDVVIEAGCAWHDTGLVHEDYTQANVDEIAAAIAGRVATVLLMVGWTPPKRLTEPTEGGAR